MILFGGRFPSGRVGDFSGPKAPSGRPRVAGDPEKDVNLKMLLDWTPTFWGFPRRRVPRFLPGPFQVPANFAHQQTPFSFSLALIEPTTLGHCDNHNSSTAATVIYLHTQPHTHTSLRVCVPTGQPGLYDKTQICAYLCPPFTESHPVKSILVQSSPVQSRAQSRPVRPSFVSPFQSSPADCYMESLLVPPRLSQIKSLRSRDRF